MCYQLIFFNESCAKKVVEHVFAEIGRERERERKRGKRKRT